MQRKSLLKHYWLALTVSGVVLLWVVLQKGVPALWPVLILAAVEITFSFDNAVLNSEILSKMTKIWRTLFLTVGIAIAVFGVRLVLPLILVALTTNESLRGVLDLAMRHPEAYAEHLHEGYPVIAAFGGTFLLMIGLRFLAEDREAKWFHLLEHNISKFNRPWLIPIAGASVTTLAIVTLLRPGDLRLLVAAIAGAVSFIGIKYISEAMESGHTVKTGGTKRNLMNFLYLELLDASFSFDGVIAAFAITKDILLITAGLGIGALYVRSITVHLLENGTLNEYRYLVHGAHYAIAILGLALILSTRIELPEWFTGLIGIGIIVWAYLSSIRHNRANAKPATV